MNSPGKLRGIYKENTFDVLKQRHDNFNFGKAIQKRQEFYDSMYVIQGL